MGAKEYWQIFFDRMLTEIESAEKNGADKYAVLELLSRKYNELSSVIEAGDFKGKEKDFLRGMLIGMASLSGDYMLSVLNYERNKRRMN